MDLASSDQRLIALTSSIPTLPGPTEMVRIKPSQNSMQRFVGLQAPTSTMPLEGGPAAKRPKVVNLVRAQNAGAINIRFRPMSSPTSSWVGGGSASRKDSPAQMASTEHAFPIPQPTAGHSETVTVLSGPGLSYRPQLPSPTIVTTFRPPMASLTRQRIPFPNTAQHNLTLHHPTNYGRPVVLRHQAQAKLLTPSVATSPFPVGPKAAQKPIKPAITAAPSVPLPLPSILAPRVKPNEPKRKPCNCNRSQCLKLYCDCFANGEFCKDCNCLNCANNMKHEGERSKAIKLCLERNPLAFQPKVGKGGQGSERHHFKGCHCKKSSCLKNYCECYEAKVTCNSHCKCVDCRNVDWSRHAVRFTPRSLMHLASVAEATDFLQREQHFPSMEFASREDEMPPPLPDTNNDANLGLTPNGQLLEAPTAVPSTSAEPRVIKVGVKDPRDSIEEENGMGGIEYWDTLLRDEVIDVTAECLLAQAVHAEQSGADPVAVERAVLKEFGQCLEQLVNCANNAFLTEASKTKLERFQL